MYIHSGGGFMDHVAIRAWGNSQGIRIPKDILEKIDESAKYKVTPAYLQDSGDVEYGEEGVYGLNIEKFLEKMNGFETSNKYCVAFTTIAHNKEKFDDIVKYMFDVQ